MTLSDGSSLQIPADAVSATITINMVATPGLAAPAGTVVVGTAYTLTPEGQQFTQPLALTLAFDPTMVPSNAGAAQIVIYTAPVGSTSWTPMMTSLVDATHVGATTTHFSVFVPVIPVSGTDGGTQGIVTDAGPGCLADTVTSTSASCSAMACSTLAGTVITSCTDSATGYAAVCCTPALDTDAGMGNPPGYPAVAGNYTRLAGSVTAGCKNGKTIVLQLAPAGGAPLTVTQNQGALTAGVLTGTLQKDGTATFSSGTQSALTGTYQGTTTTVGGTITEAGSFNLTPSKSFNAVLNWTSSDGNCTPTGIEDSWTAN